MTHVQRAKIEKTPQDQKIELFEAGNEIDKNENIENQNLEAAITIENEARISELKQKQEAQRAFRTTTPEGIRLLGAAHQAQLEELAEQQKLLNMKQ